MKKLLLSCFLTCLGSLAVSSLASNAYGAESGYFEKIFAAPDKPSPGTLSMGAEWRLWIPEGVEQLKGVIVHQHGCGSGSGDGGRTGAYDLHWQALARKHSCALIASSFRQGDLPCEDWCDPRNGSAQSFLNALEYFAEYTGHEELTTIPWALWGHSGGGQWVGCMTQLYPRRVAAAWLRSGCPDTVVQIFNELPMNDDVRNVPMMLNLGAFEHDFAIIWKPGWNYYRQMREQGAKIGMLVDPTTHHETGSSRYPAIRFFDEVLAVRLGGGDSAPLPSVEGLILPVDAVSDREISAEGVVSDPDSATPILDASERREYLKDGIWLPSSEYVDVWRKYAVDASFDDATPPPAPTDVAISSETRLMTWNCVADLESGLKTFNIYENGKLLTTLPTAPSVNSRPVFQGVMYSDTPDYSLPKMEYEIPDFNPQSVYSITAINTCNLESEPVNASVLQSAAE